MLAWSFEFAFFLAWSLISFGNADHNWLRLVLLSTWSQFFLTPSYFGRLENLLFFDARDRNIVFENLISLSRKGLLLW